MPNKSMRFILSKDTKPEMIVRRFLHSLGFRFRLHNKNLPGKPDLTLKKYHTAIFVHGCFWHSHGLNCGIKARIPKTNLEYWGKKLARNIERDRYAQAMLKENGWQVLVVWECELKKQFRGATFTHLVNRLLSNTSLYNEIYE
jgi:DNA mismatch endonuclease (patch repair protein)